MKERIWCGFLHNEFVEMFVDKTNGTPQKVIIDLWGSKVEVGIGEIFDIPKFNDKDVFHVACEVAELHGMKLSKTKNDKYVYTLT